jgi:hypothetical protein
MTMVQSFLEYVFAGLWAEIWRFGLGFGLMILCFAGAYFSPIWKKDFLWAGIVIAVFMVAFTTGVVVGERHIRMQWAAATVYTIDNANKARRNAVRTVHRKPSRWLPNNRDGDFRDR